MHPDPLWMKLFLAVHVTAGLVSFVLAPVALATAKGGKQHRRWGMVYLGSMGVVTCTALPMALFRPVLFLALVSVISAYLAFSGYRVLKLKNLASGGSARPIDWAAACIALVVSVFLVALGWFRPAAVQHMQAVAIFLGSLGTRGIVADMWRFVQKPTEKMFWWYSHLTNSSAATLQPGRLFLPLLSVTFFVMPGSYFGSGQRRSGFRPSFLPRLTTNESLPPASLPVQLSALLLTEVESRENSRYNNAAAATLPSLVLIIELAFGDQLVS